MQISSLPKTVAAADIPPEQLAHNTVLSEQEKISEASRQFEAILLRQILSATQKPVIPSKFVDDSTASQIYQDMVNDQLAQSISKSGAFGLAKVFEHQLTPPAAIRLEKGIGVSGTDSSSSAGASYHPARHSDAKSPILRAQLLNPTADLSSSK